MTTFKHNHATYVKELNKTTQCEDTIKVQICNSDPSMQFSVLRTVYTVSKVLLILDAKIQVSHGYLLQLKEGNEKDGLLTK